MNTEKFARYCIPILVVVAGGVLCAYVYIFIQNAENDIIDTQYTNIYNLYATAVSNADVITDFMWVQALDRFISFEGNISKGLFESYSELLFDSRSSGITGVFWCPQIRNRTIVETRASREYGKPVRIAGVINDTELEIPSTFRDVYYPVLYMNPFFEILLLLNIYDINVRKAGIDLAIQTQTDVATEFIPPNSIFINHPVFLLNSTEVLGIIIFGYDFSKLVVRIFMNTFTPNTFLELYDNTNRDRPEFLGVFNIDGRVSNFSVSVVYNRSIPFSFGTRQWIANVLISEQFEHTLTSQNALITVSVMVSLIVLLAVAITCALQRASITLFNETKRHNKALRDFTAYVFHEVRVPFNTIKLGILYLFDHPDEIQKIIKVMYGNVNQIGVILDDVLDMSKIEDGSFSIQKTSFKLSQLAENIKWTISPVMNEKKLNFITDFCIPDNCDLISGDVTRIQQCLNNLLTNASKFTPAGGNVIFTIKSERRSDNVICVDFKVTDTGIGIAENAMGYLFKPFSQIANAETRKLHARGTGLGLYLTKTIVEQHGGHIEVDSKLNEGSTFRINIPFESKDEHIDIPETIIEMEILKLSKPHTKALIVEDNESNSLILSLHLESKGIDFDIAENGKIGFEMTQKNQYDVIFMDKSMPEMNGLEATKCIRDSGVHTPIIVLTGNAFHTEKENFMKAGANHFLSKPFNINSLYNILKQIGIFQ